MPRRAKISEAVEYQDRIKFHSQTYLNRYSSSSVHLTAPLNNYLNWVQTLIPSDKYEIFANLFRFPVATNELTATCFDKLSRVFDGRNPVNNYQFVNPQNREDWETYRKDILHEPEVWQQLGWEKFKTEINSVLVVDLPAEVDGEPLPSPYFYWLGIENVIDYEIDPVHDCMAYIIFHNGENTIAVIDGSSYRVFDYTDNKLGRKIADNRHDLGYCPCRFFWTEPVSDDNRDLKASPLTKVLSKLDWYLFFHISKQHLDTYGSYPIYSGYEQECDYTDAEGNYCEGGFLKDKKGNYIPDEHGLMRCPKCGDKHIAGAGSYIEVPIPMEGQPDLNPPVHITTIDKQSLDYQVAEEIRLREQIINTVVGLDNEVLTTQAVNEAQIQATFENKSAILNRVKKGFEEAQKFVDDTICRLRYGGSFLSSAINYGTEFYTLTAQEIRKRYKQAKDGGANESDLDAIQRQLIETEYRNDPVTRQRQLILADIEPYRHLSVKEALDLYKDDILSKEELRLKSNFASYIRRFERENTDIISFGTALSYDNKITAILNRLKEYAAENMPITNNNQQEQ